MKLNSVQSLFFFCLFLAVLEIPIFENFKREVCHYCTYQANWVPSHIRENSTNNVSPLHQVDPSNSVKVRKTPKRMRFFLLPRDVSFPP